MTTEELRDWHARRAGWAFKYNSWWHPTIMACYHPFPATLDGADAAMPPNWRWERDVVSWWAGQTGENRWKCGRIDDTGDKIHDLYALSKLAWEQEAAR